MLGAVVYPGFFNGGFQDPSSVLALPHHNHIGSELAANTFLKVDRVVGC